MIGIVQVGSQQRADRYTYFALIGLFIAAAWTIPALLPAGLWRTRVLPILAAFALAIFAAASFVQVGYWRNTETLFRHAIDSGWDSAFARNALGTAVATSGRTDEGITLLESAVRMSPGVAQWEFNLAVELQKAGRIEAAAQHYQAALAIDEHSSKAHNNLGVLLGRMQRYEESTKNLERSIELDPAHAKTYLNLGALCLQTGKYADAIKYTEQAQCSIRRFLAAISISRWPCGLRGMSTRRSAGCNRI